MTTDGLPEGKIAPGCAKYPPQVHGDFGIVLGKDEQETAEIARALNIKRAATSEVSPRSRHGSDGHRPLVGCVIVTGRFRLFLPNSPQRMAA